MCDAPVLPIPGYCALLLLRCEMKEDCVGKIRLDTGDKHRSDSSNRLAGWEKVSSCSKCLVAGNDIEKVRNAFSSIRQKDMLELGLKLESEGMPMRVARFLLAIVAP